MVESWPTRLQQRYIRFFEKKYVSSTIMVPELKQNQVSETARSIIWREIQISKYELRKNLSLQYVKVNRLNVLVQFVQKNLGKCPTI